MNLSFSHIAWPPEAELFALEYLRLQGVSEVEVAPLRAFGNPYEAKESTIRERAQWYQEKGFRISSFQALLFGSENVELFGTSAQIERLKQLLIAVGRIAGWAGAKAMVFGSPRNRLKGEIIRADAMRLAASFFREVGDACAEAGSCLVMEANPEAYGADFCTRFEEAAELVTMADSPGFGLHLDAGGLALSQENFEPLLRQVAGLLRHVHASQPNLASFAKPDPIHRRVANILKEIGYCHTVAIEMKTQPDVFMSVQQAIGASRRIYGI